MPRQPYAEMLVIKQLNSVMDRIQIVKLWRCVKDGCDWCVVDEVDGRMQSGGDDRLNMTLEAHWDTHA